MLQDSMDEPLTELSNDFALPDCKLESATGEVNVALRSNELSPLPLLLHSYLSTKPVCHHCTQWMGEMQESHAHVDPLLTLCYSGTFLGCHSDALNWSHADLCTTRGRRPLSTSTLRGRRARLKADIVL